MEGKAPLGRYPQTRRISGRRGLTPIRSKKKVVLKTRGHKVEKKRYVPLRKHTGSQHTEERLPSDTDKHSQDSEWKGDQDGHDSGTRHHTEEQTHVEQIRDEKDSTESVHPGPLQTVSELLEQTAVVQTSDKEEIEAEVLPPVL
jgi:hypothetical protein